MAIRVQCSCGRRLLAEDEQAGTQVRCPACQAVVAVPEGGSYGVEKVRRCPGCKHEWPVETVVCIDCGYNFDTGRKMRTKYKLVERTLDVGFAWTGSYWRYRVFRDGRGRPRLNVTRKMFFLPLRNSTYDLSTFRAVLTDFVAGDGENPDVFTLYLDGPGKRPVRIFCASGEEKMKELLDLVAQAGRLEIRRR